MNTPDTSPPETAALRNLFRSESREPPSDEARSRAMSQRWWASFALAFEIWWIGFVALQPFSDTTLTRAVSAAVPVAFVAASAVLKWMREIGRAMRTLAENKTDESDAVYFFRLVIPALLLPGQFSKRKITWLRRAVKRLPRSSRKGQFRAWRAPTRNALWAWGLLFYPTWLVVDVVEAVAGRDYWAGVRFEIFCASAGVAIVVVVVRTIALVRRTRKNFGDPLDNASTVGLAGLVIAEVVVNAPRRVARRLVHHWVRYLIWFWGTRLLNLLALLFLVAVVFAWFESTTLLNFLAWWSPGVVVFLIWRHRKSRKKGAGREKQED